MKFGKREIVVSLLAALLGGAVFVNWQVGADTPDTTPYDDDLGTAHYVNASISTKDTPSQKISQPASKESEYFSKVRLERQKTQDELLTMARSMAESENTTGEAKTQAVRRLNELLGTINKQSNVEGLIMSKGFTDCIAYIENGECSVVVTGKELKSDTLTAIKDIVTTQTGISFDKIRVSQV
ncbi:MAG: SpoIIIAH-like family protein [Clostridia bacterium]|nr:SpoIIIAH-like family protein [Clostridia bacterium]